MKPARTLLILFAFCLTLSSLAWAGYTVSPGDTVDMQVVAHDNLNTKQQVAPDGTVSFPLAGRLTVQGNRWRNWIRCFKPLIYRISKIHKWWCL